jgi:transcriptional regulator
MYIPSAFRVDDPGKLAAFIQRHSFATLVTHDGLAPFASHLPMLFRPQAGTRGTLVSHMARANPQWEHFAAGGEVLAIFQGPHSYISPSWYQSAPAVPTWNYTAVHAYGIPSVIADSQRVIALLDETIATYEAGLERPWPGNLPGEFRDKLAQGIVAFEIPVNRIEGKFKLGQNRSEADARGVHEALSRSSDADSRALAELMQAERDFSRPS